MNEQAKVNVPVDALAVLDDEIAASHSLSAERLSEVRANVVELIAAAQEVAAEYAARFGTESGSAVGPLDREIRALNAALTAARGGA